jgi:hypothetical protein
MEPGKAMAATGRVEKINPAERLSMEKARVRKNAAEHQLSSPAPVVSEQ